MKKINRFLSILMLVGLSAFMLSFTGLAAKNPSKPTGLTVVKTGHRSITVSWEKSYDADFYRVYIRDDGEWVALDDLAGTKYKFSGLLPSKSYTFAVRSVKESKNKDYLSNGYSTINVKTKSLSKVKPTAVSGVDYVTLNWKKVTSAKGYAVYRRVDSKWKLIKKLSDNNLSYTVKGLKSDTAYKFSVRPYVKADGETVYGPHSSVSISTMKPNKVKLTVVSASQNAVKLKWTKAPDATGYRIYHYDDGEWKTVKTVNSAKTLAATVTSLESDSRHKFRVKAFRTYPDRTVWFVASASVSATTEPSKSDLAVYRTENLKAQLSQDFTLSYETENESYGDVSVTISKSGEKYYLYSKVNYTEYELLNIPSGNYVLLKQKKSYAKAPDAISSALDVSSAVSDLLPSKGMKARVTLESFENQNTICETYSNVSGSRKIRYFYRTGELVGIEEYSSGRLVERAVVTKFEQSALKGVFKVPSGYKKLSY